MGGIWETVRVWWVKLVKWNGQRTVKVGMSLKIWDLLGQQNLVHGWACEKHPGLCGPSQALWPNKASKKLVGWNLTYCVTWSWPGLSSSSLSSFQLKKAWSKNSSVNIPSDSIFCCPSLLLLRSKFFVAGIPKRFFCAGLSSIPLACSEGQVAQNAPWICSEPVLVAMGFMWSKCTATLMVVHTLGAPLGDSERVLAAAKGSFILPEVSGYLTGGMTRRNHKFVHGSFNLEHWFVAQEAELKTTVAKDLGSNPGWS